MNDELEVGETGVLCNFHGESAPLLNGMIATVTHPLGAYNVEVIRCDIPPAEIRITSNSEWFHGFGYGVDIPGHPQIQFVLKPFIRRIRGDDVDEKKKTSHPFDKSVLKI